MVEDIKDALNIIDGHIREGHPIRPNSEALKLLMKTGEKMLEIKETVDNIYYNQNYHSEGFNRARLILDTALEDIE